MCVYGADIFNLVINSNVIDVDFLMKRKNVMNKIRVFFKSDNSKYFHIAIIVILSMFFAQCGCIRDAYIILFFSGITLLYVVLNKKNIFGYREILLAMSIGIYGYFSLELKACFCMTSLLLIFQCLGKALEGYIRCRYEKENFLLFYFALVLIIGYSVHALLNSLFATTLTRNWPDFWIGIDLPATQHALFFLPIFSLAFPCIMCFKNRKFGSVLIWILIFVDLCFSLYVENRMVLVVFMAVCTIQIIYYMFDREIDAAKKKKAVKNLIILVLLLLICLIILGAWVYKFQPIRWIGLRKMISRNGGIVKNIRFEAQREAIKQLFVYPMGGFKMELCGLKSSHNVWLDIANASGIIPFFLFVAYTLISIVDLIRYLWRSDDSHIRKNIVLGLYTVFFLYYTVEPALLATYYYLIPWVFINGMISVHRK